MLLHLGKDKYFFHYIRENLRKIVEKKAIFGLGMPPVTGGKTGQIKSLYIHVHVHVYIVLITGQVDKH